MCIRDRIMNFTFNSQDFEKDFDKWENLKKKYEKQAKSSIPDSVLIALLLGKTSGALLTHLRLNLASLKTYDQLRQEILSYHKSLYVLQGQGTSVDKGPTPMEVDALIAAFQKKGYFKGKGKGNNFKGKGNFKGSKGKGKSHSKGYFGGFGNFKGTRKGGKTSKGYKGKSKGKKGGKGLGQTSQSSHSTSQTGSVNGLESSGSEACSGQELQEKKKPGKLRTT